jgi:hypothetical protein
MKLSRIPIESSAKPVVHRGPGRLFSTQMERTARRGDFSGSDCCGDCPPARRIFAFLLFGFWAAYFEFDAVRFPMISLKIFGYSTGRPKWRKVLKAVLRYGGNFHGLSDLLCSDCAQGPGRA